MKNLGVFITILASIFIVLPFLSGEIILNSQPLEVYSFGDTISIPINIVATKDASDFLEMVFVCGEESKNFPQGVLQIKVGEEEQRILKLPLEKKFIGEMKGECFMKIIFDERQSSTRVFEISDSIKIESELSGYEFSPGDFLPIKGFVKKESHLDSSVKNGFIEVSFLDGEKVVLSQKDTISNSSFIANLDLPKNLRAGLYSLKVDAYEINSENERTNKGSSVLNQRVRILQVPTSLELVFDSKEVKPGSDLKVKAVLYDQTGEKISSMAKLTLLDRKGKIIEQVEVPTDLFFEYSIALNELPFEWKVNAEVGEFKKTSSFRILEKENLGMELLDRVLTITNIGNVLYNGTASISIGEEEFEIPVYLNVGQSERYLLKAPDGRYPVGIIAGENSLFQDVALTGKSIEVMRTSSGRRAFLNPVVWVFIILLLGFATLITFKRGYKQTFIGYVSSRVSRRKKNVAETLTPLPKDSMVNPRNRAEFSISIKGEKQHSSIVSLNIKNLDELKSSKGNARETLQEIADFAEANKASTYESNKFIFFILSPLKTKTFKNAKTAFDIAQKTKEILENHNKLFKQKIDFGISINEGNIIAKQDQESLKFMGIGSLMISSKKIASLANKEILLSEKTSDALKQYLKSSKEERSGVPVYSIKEMKNYEEHQKFLKSFMERN